MAEDIKETKATSAPIDEAKALADIKYVYKKIMSEIGKVFIGQTKVVEEVLYAVEYGAGLSFTFMDESSFTLQKTLYPEYYGADFSLWHDKMVEIYNEYNEKLGHTFNQEIVDHEMLTEDVTVTVYEDGTKAYVNYGYSDYSADGITVPARDYYVVK